MNEEEREESPYCGICGHCGDIGCCGISNFIDKHIKGKTDCKNEEIVISELEDLCNYQTETFKDNEKLQSQLDIANKKLEETKEYINKNIRHEYRNGRNNEFYLELNENKLKQLLSIIGGVE